MSSFTSLSPPTQSPSDSRIHKSYLLSNGLTLLLTSYPSSPKSSAALNVQVGAGADPSSIPGLAHFCEHMVFLGSKDYPEENAYKKMISKSGGSSNASTSMESTTFKFVTTASHLSTVLPCFTSFFTSPLMTSSGVSREVNAVDSENSKNLTSDARRRLQILKSRAIQTNSGYSNFSTGNLKTIYGSRSDSQVRELLLNFHKLHYTSNRMSAVVIGPQSIEELEELVIPLLNSIPEIHDDVPTEGIVYEAASRYSKMSHLKPESSWSSPIDYTLFLRPLRSVIRKLYLSFPLPPQRYLKDDSPVRLLGHLLGHESCGSIFYYLQKKGLASSLSAGVRMEDEGQCFFQVQVGLTEEGVEEWEEVGRVVFEYVKMLEGSGSEDFERIWKEKVEIAKMHFNMSSPGEPYAFAPFIARRLGFLNTEEVLRSGSMVNDPSFDLKGFRDFLSRFNADNCLIELQSQRLYDESNGKIESEKYYDIEYKTEPNSVSTLKFKQLKGIKELKLPVPNMYIPSSLELNPNIPSDCRTPQIKKPCTPPTLLQTNSWGRLFHKLDDRYALPTAYIALFIRTPLSCYKEGRYDIKRETLGGLYVGAFEHGMKSIFYEAGLAGMGYGVGVSRGGVSLRCHGYNDRLGDFCVDVLRRFGEGGIEEEWFEIVKERKVRGLRSFYKERPDYYAGFLEGLVLHPEGGSIEEMVEVLEACTFKEVKQWKQQVLNQYEHRFVDLTCMGNIDSGEATELFDRVGQILGTEPSSPNLLCMGKETRLLDEGEEYRIHVQSKNEDEENGAVTVLFQGKEQSFTGRNSNEGLRSTASVKLLGSILREPLFNELRTKQTLGYIVSSALETHFSVTRNAVSKVDAVGITVVSKKADPVDIVNRIDSFLDDFTRILKTMPESEIESHKSSLYKKLLDPWKKLYHESADAASRIRRYAPEGVEDIPWDPTPTMAEEITKLTREDMLRSWESIVVGKKRSRIVTCVHGKFFPYKGGARKGVRSLVFGGKKVLEGVDDTRKAGFDLCRLNGEGSEWRKMRLRVAMGLRVGVIVGTVGLVWNRLQKKK